MIYRSSRNHPLFSLIYRQQLMYYNTNKIYRRNLIDKLSFNDLTVGLDTIFNYQIFAQCKTILLTVIRITTIFNGKDRS